MNLIIKTKHYWFSVLADHMATFGSEIDPKLGRSVIEAEVDF